MLACLLYISQINQRVGFSNPFPIVGVQRDDQSILPPGHVHKPGLQWDGMGWDGPTSNVLGAIYIYIIITLNLTFTSSTIHCKNPSVHSPARDTNHLQKLQCSCRLSTSCRCQQEYNKFCSIYRLSSCHLDSR